jgi:hypothetical protein
MKPTSSQSLISFSVLDLQKEEEMLAKVIQVSWFQVFNFTNYQNENNQGPILYSFSWHGLTACCVKRPVNACLCRHLQIWKKMLKFVHFC